LLVLLIGFSGARIGFAVMTKRWLLVVVVLCVAALAVPWLASAQHQVVQDGNDTAGPLDVRRVKVDFTERPRWTIGTWNGWTVERLWDRGYFLIQLDTFSTERFDYYAFVRSTGYGMKGTLVRDRAKKPDYTVSKIKAFKSARNQLRVRFPLSKMRIGDGRLFYRWAVQTIATMNKCPTSCFDLAPNQGAVREPVPGRIKPTPTVSPTPTITETPTPVPTDTP
jgi:hypothetical protein